MSEEKDVAQVEAEMAALEARGGDAHNGVGPKGASGGDAVPPQLEPSPGAARAQGRRAAGRSGWPGCCTTFDPATAEAIRASLPRGPAGPGRRRRLRADRRAADRPALGAPSPAAGRSPPAPPGPVRASDG